MRQRKSLAHPQSQTKTVKRYIYSLSLINFKGFKVKNRLTELKKKYRNEQVVKLKTRVRRGLFQEAESPSWSEKCW